MAEATGRLSRAALKQMQRDLMKEQGLDPDSAEFRTPIDIEDLTEEACAPLRDNPSEELDIVDAAKTKLVRVAKEKRRYEEMVKPMPRLLPNTKVQTRPLEPSITLSPNLLAWRTQDGYAMQGQYIYVLPQEPNFEGHACAVEVQGSAPARERIEIQIGDILFFLDSPHAWFLKNVVLYFTKYAQKPA